MNNDKETRNLLSPSFNCDTQIPALLPDVSVKDGDKKFKYAILPLPIFRRYIIIASPSNPSDFCEEFELDEEGTDMIKNIWRESRAFMYADYLPGIVNGIDTEYGQRVYYIVTKNDGEHQSKITHGVLSHEISHVVHDLIFEISSGLKGNVNVGSFEDECVSNLTQLITDFAYEFFHENGVHIYLASEVEFKLKDKFLDNVKNVVIY